VCLLLSICSLAPAQTADRRLRDLAARAESRAVWPQLRSLAEKATDAERRGRAYLVLGYREYDAGEIEGASKDLRAATETGFSLADHARFYWGDAGHQAGKPAETIEALDDFATLHARSTRRLAALELLAKALLETGQPDRAIQGLTSEPQTRRRPQLSILLAQAYRDAKNPAEAARIFQEIYNSFPLSSQAGSAQEAIAQLRAELGANFPEASEEIQTARADILAGKSRWRDALDEYKQLQEGRPASPLAPRWQLGRARCLIRLRQGDEAVNLLSGSLSSAPELDAERLGLMIDALLQNSDLSGAQQVLDLLRSLYPQAPPVATALSAFGNVYVRKGDWREAARYYQPLAAQFPQAAGGREAHWRLAWSFYLDGDMTRADQTFVDHLSRYPDSDHAPGALYWLGRIAEQRGAAEEAQSLYRFLRQRFVHSYFAQQAEPRLAALADAPRQGGSAAQPVAAVMQALAKMPPRGAAPLRPCEEVAPSETLEPFLTLTSLSLDDLAEQYLTASVKDAPKLPDLRLALSRLRAEEKKFALALFEAKAIAPRAPDYDFSDLPQEFWRLLYPQEYLTLVKRNARANAIDPGLVLGLIRQESAFNPLATSSANARGLMQILPQTASRTRKGRARAARRLYDPAFNVQFGTRHLSGLLKMLGGSPEQALAAYHAGELRVKEWLGQRTYQEQAEFLETIPIPATRVYVEAVLRDRGIYRDLLAGEAKFVKCGATSARNN